jgi:putative ABC transport system permease protein
MHSVRQDVGYFFRSVRKAPGFFFVAVLTLALGIGANTAIFSAVNAVLLRPLPFDEPDRLVRLFETEAAPGIYPFAGPDYLDWQAQNRTLEGMSLIEYRGRVNVSGGGQADSALALRIEADFFTVLGARAALGRTFVPDDGSAGAGRVAVVSYGFWQRRFGGDPAIVGRSIDLDSERHTVVGVMPAWFNYPRGMEVWTPLDMSPRNLGPRGSHNYLAVGRLKRGVTVSQALADLSLIAKRLETQFPDSNEKVGAAVFPMQEFLTRQSREPLLILLGAVALVLLVACANVANLLLIRAGGRRRELAVRSALGAGRGRIVLQLLTESVLLALAGAAAGLAAAWWGVRLLRSVESLPLPTVNPIQIDVPVLLFTLGTALVTGLLFGILPALQASAVRPGEELKSVSHGAGGAGRRSRHWRDGIAVAEIAVSLALLVGAGLLLRSFDSLRRAEIGADMRNVVTMGINLPAVRYATPVARRALFDRLLDRVRSTPGVRFASVSTRIPTEGGSNGYITVPGQDDTRLRNQLFEWNYVSADYFRAFGIPLVRGRSFEPRDENRAAAVAAVIAEAFSTPNPSPDALKGRSWPAVISRQMADLVWPNQDPVGRTFVMGRMLSAEVIGVAGDVKSRGLRDGAAPQAYLAFAGALSDAGPATLTVKAVDDPTALLASLRGHVNALDSTLAVVNPRTMEAVIADGMADTTLQTFLIALFAAVATLLAAVGLYSVMSFIVAQRRRELGIRIALGAAQVDLVRLVLGHAAKLTAIGVFAGVCAAYWLARLMRGLLFGVAADEPATFAAVSGLVVLVAFVACVVPARRAMRVNPIVALRQE